ncbi:DivIVA domain-containing protein [Lacihabitans lacunae]|uniref:DivIVA domain-containing protein n=1 Tax=Lacihabitans lacunae TaxID=1028214 RepID=A0ABV7YV35_9BACT
MKITSLEIKQHEFEKSFRGYDIEEVNSFLSNLAAEWDRMLNDSKMLKMQLEIAEKEASKLREVEMTLIKTLRTAEDTSTRITESAETEASKKLADAENKAKIILADAENAAKNIVEEAEQKASELIQTSKKEFSGLENEFNALEAKKAAILNSLAAIASETSEVIQNHGGKIELPVFEIETKQSFAPQAETSFKPEIDEEIFVEKELHMEAPSLANEEEEEEENSQSVSFSSAVNEINLETQEEKTNLELIEGIGPKIKEILNSARIYTFRDLATTPIYRIKDILAAAGPQFGMHDPSTWVEQALLAEEGQWEQLTELKNYLEAGRVPKEDLPKEDMHVSRLENSESNTEEMLDKVNKVKAAIRKAMVEKNAEPKEIKPASEYLDEKKQGGSFFDNLN